MGLDQILQLGLTTFVSAAAGSGLIVFLSWNSRRIARRNYAKEQLLGAIEEHIRALESYDNLFQQQALLGVGNAQSNKGQFAPQKPSIHSLVLAFRRAAIELPLKAQLAIGQAERLALAASPQHPQRAKLADWESEAAEFNMLAVCISAWDGKSSSLPEVRPNRTARADLKALGELDYPSSKALPELDYHVLPSNRHKKATYFDLNR
ncbi:MAG: hypothetical protein ACTJG8_04590 [Canibacter sp.]